MWVISGPFDGATSGEIGFTKTKLLKTGTSYTVGRKAKTPTQLVIHHPKVSGEHAQFSVAECDVPDVSNPSKRPTLTFFDKRSKVTSYIRGGETFAIDKGITQVLEDGDSVHLISNLAVTVHWRTVCCFSPPEDTSVDIEICAALGINVVQTPDLTVTHHLTPTLSLSSAIATSMLSAAHLVKPDWLTEFIELGTEPHNASIPNGPSKLEFEFIPPTEKNFFPPFEADIPKPLQSIKKWAPNPDRVGIFQGWQFVFLMDKNDGPENDLKPLVSAGGGIYDLFDVTAGPARFRSMLTATKMSANKRGKGMAIVGDDVVKESLGSSWSSMDDVLRNLGIRVISPSQVVEAVVYIDASRIESTANGGTEASGSAASSGIPSFVPNTHADEPSHIPDTAEEAAQRPRRTTRASSRAPSLPPADTANAAASATQSAQHTEQSKMDDEPVAPVKKKRNLVRRANTNVNAIVGVDDPSIIIDSEAVSAAVSEAASPPPSTSVAPTPSSRTSRLKRRAGATPFVNPLIAELEKAMDTSSTASTQPTLQKFKALFDDADPDKDHSQTQFPPSIGYSQMDGDGDTDSILNHSQIPTHMESSAGNEDVFGSTQMNRLGAIAEEEEGSQSQSGSGSAPKRPAGRGEKRTLDVVMEESEESQPAKRTAIEGVNGVQSTQQPNGTSQSQQKFTTKSQSQSQAQKSRKGENAGAAPGNPDKDAAFLKALASQKKGKRSEDITDREFNNLRISKPELQKDQQAKDWAVLDEFARDEDLRGNFMVIVEMEVPDKPSRVNRRAGGRVDWEGKPDFKKFKHKQNTQREIVPVELAVDDENDYGMGSGYWKGTSQSQTQSQAYQSQSQVDNTAHLQPSQTQNKTAAKPKSKSQSLKPPSRSKVPSSQQAAKGKGKGLKIIDSDEDDEELIVLPGTQKGKKTGSSQSQTKSQKGKTVGKRKADALFLESEDDEDGANGNGKSDHDIDEDDEIMEMDGAPPPTLQSTVDDPDGEPTRTTRSGKPPSTAAKRKKPPAIVVDDDSDTGVTFKGFGGRKKLRMK